MGEPLVPPGRARDSLLRRLAKTPGQSLRTVGAALGVSRERARVELARLGLKLRAAARPKIAAPRKPARVMTPAQLRAAVERSGLTQAEVAQAVGTGARSFRRLLQDEDTPGHRRITPEMQVRLDAVLKARRARRTDPFDRTTRGQEY